MSQVRAVNLFDGKVEDLEKLAGGRVWSGRQAKANGLIDELGTLNQNNIGSWPFWAYVGSIIVVVVLILGLGNWYMVSPKSDELDQVIKQEQTLRDEFERKQKKVANLDAYKQQLAEMQDARISATLNEDGSFSAGAEAMYQKLRSEIVELVIMEMGHDFVVDYLPWKRGYILSKKGKYAATYPYLLTEEREDEFLYSAPIIEWESKVYVRRDSGIEYNSSLDLLGLRECLPHHYGGLPELDKLHAAGSIKRVSTPYIKSCWLMILNGRADFFVEDVFVADIFRREVLAERSNEVVELQKTISTDYGHIIFPKGFDQSEELVAGFNDTLVKLSERGEIARIKESFLKQHTQLVDLIN